METARLRSFTGIAVVSVLGAAAILHHTSSRRLRDEIDDYAVRNAVLTDNLQTATETIDRLAERIGVLEEEARLATEAADWMQYQVARTSGDGRYLWQRSADLAERGRFREAKDTLETLVRRYPKSPYVPQARVRIVRLENDVRRVEIAGRIREAARERQFDDAEGMLARAAHSLPPETRDELTAFLSEARSRPPRFSSPEELRQAAESGMPVGVPYRVDARLGRERDLLEDPNGGSSPAVSVRVPASKRSDVERLRGRAACHTVTMSLDGSLHLVESAPGSCSE